MKYCPSCKIHLVKENFGRDRSQPDGLQKRCRPCARARSEVYRKSHPDRVRATLKASKAKRKNKAASYNAEYYRRDAERQRKRAQDWRLVNQELTKLTTARWRAANKERFAEMQNAWRAENRTRLAAYRKSSYDANRERELEGARNYKAANPAKMTALNMKRVAAKLRATPVWADFQAIESVYAEARRLTAETGIPHHVDHIYPLQSNWVCGLHVENNLQILTASANQSKSNRRLAEATL